MADVALEAFCAAFLSNFGSSGFCNHSSGRCLGKLVYSICFLTGVVIFTGYNASITSELAVVRRKLPFNSLETLIESNYRYIWI